MPDATGNRRDIKHSVIVAGLLLAWDGALFGMCLMAWLVCPVWFCFSLAKCAMERPGWGSALVRIGCPLLTFGLLWVNAAFQVEIAEANARRVIAACEAYHVATGKLPDKLDDLVPRYFDSIPRAKYCLGWSRFAYHNLGSPKLDWYVFPPYDRKIYDLETRSWSYLN